MIKLCLSDCTPVYGVNNLFRQQTLNSAFGGIQSGFYDVRQRLESGGQIQEDHN